MHRQVVQCPCDVFSLFRSRCQTIHLTWSMVDESKANSHRTGLIISHWMAKAKQIKAFHLVLSIESHFFLFKHWSVFFSSLSSLLVDKLIIAILQKIKRLWILYSPFGFISVWLVGWFGACLIPVSHFFVHTFNALIWTLIRYAFGRIVSSDSI